MFGWIEWMALSEYMFGTIILQATGTLSSCRFEEGLEHTVGLAESPRGKGTRRCKRCPGRLRVGHRAEQLAPGLHLNRGRPWAAVPRCAAVRGMGDEGRYGKAGTAKKQRPFWPFFALFEFCVWSSPPFVPIGVNSKHNRGGL